MAEVCVSSDTIHRVRHKCRKFGRKSVSRQITVNRGVIVKQRDLVETWLLARQLSQRGGEESGRGNRCAGPAFVLPVRLERTEPECITSSGSGDAVEKLLNMHKLY